MKTIKSILELLEGMKKEEYLYHDEKYHRTKHGKECDVFIYNKALEQAKPIIEGEMRELLEGLKGDKIRRAIKEGEIRVCEKCSDAVIKAEDLGYNQRTAEINKKIEEII